MQAHVRHRPVRVPRCDAAVRGEDERATVGRTQPGGFSGQVAQRHLQPDAHGPMIDDAAQFQVEQLPDPQSGSV